MSSTGFHYQGGYSQQFDKQLRPQQTAKQPPHHPSTQTRQTKSSFCDHPYQHGQYSPDPQSSPQKQGFEASCAASYPSHAATTRPQPMATTKMAGFAAGSQSSTSNCQGRRAGQHRPQHDSQSMSASRGTANPTPIQPPSTKMHPCRDSYAQPHLVHPLPLPVPPEPPSPDKATTQMACSASL